MHSPFPYCLTCSPVLLASPCFHPHPLAHLLVPQDLCPVSSSLRSVLPAPLFPACSFDKYMISLPSFPLTCFTSHPYSTSHCIFSFLAPANSSIRIPQPCSSTLLSIFPLFSDCSITVDTPTPCLELLSPLTSWTLLAPHSNRSLIYSPLLPLPCFPYKAVLARWHSTFLCLLRTSSRYLHHIPSPSLSAPLLVQQSPDCST
jgi:hypothetical protein